MALAATPLAPSAGDFAAEGHFNRILPVTGPAEVTLRTGTGTVNVIAANQSSVHVHAIIRAGRGLCSDEEAEKRIRSLEARPPVEQYGDTVIVGALTEPSLPPSITISYEVVVPTATRLKCQTGSGDQTIRGISGPLELSAASGKIKASGIASDVVASTGSGEIELESVRGKVRVSSGSGRVEAYGIAGSFHASTGSGDVTLEQTAVAEVRATSASGDITLKNVRGRVEAKTASGSISAEGGGGEPWRLETVSGAVIVRVPLNLGFDLRAHTVRGSISSSRPLTLEGSTHQREICGKAGKGGFLLDVSTVSGDIHIDWLAGSKPSA